mgnify:CR=1 FL=1
MRLRFWGTRGSIPSPGPDTVRYGGNTSCVELRTAGDTLLVLDAGTGLRGLGDALTNEAESAGPRRGHMLISHTHWDHIQGFPFFAPIFKPGNEWNVYAPHGFGISLRDTLAGQMQYAYFPVSLDALGANIQYHDLVEGGFSIAEDVRVAARYLNHPALTLGYRIEADGVTVVYSTDHECHSRSAGLLGKPLGSILRPDHPGDRRHHDFIAGADLLIHDTQYTADEYPTRVGWGHSTMEYVVDLAVSAGVKRLALFHHDPARSDDALDALVGAARQRVADAGSAMEVFAAAEGKEIVFPDAPAKTTKLPGDDALAAYDTQAVTVNPVLIACADADLAARLRAAAEAEGLVVLAAGDAATALELAHNARPALMMIERQLVTDDGLAFYRALRAGPHMTQLPVIMLAPEDAPPGFVQAAGITDWLVTPASQEYLRTKLRAWMLRAHARWQRAPLPVDEQKRLRALRALSLLDTPAEERFDRITRLAASRFDVPIAAITLVDADRQWFKSRVGDILAQTPRDQAFCAHAILGDRALVVGDALGDDRFADNPLVTAKMRVRFYAGQPISAPDGSYVGTLCVMDHRPRDFGAADLRALLDLAALVERELRTTPTQLP